MRVSVLVHTEALDGLDPPWEVVINHNSTHHRQWLGRHCAWAFRNGMRVVTEPTDRDPDLTHEDWTDLKAAEAAERIDRLPGYEQSRRAVRESG